ncbi:MAG: general secretion pathway protein GspB [Oxalobacteraceae bacterium]
MSYILDALKKAEAQRTLGALPNIHAPAVFDAVASDRAPLWHRTAFWIALALLVVILLALAWFRPWQSGAVLQQAPSAPATAAVVAPAQTITPVLSVVPPVPTVAQAVPMRATPVAPTPRAAPPKASKPKAAVSRAPAAPAQTRPAAVAATPAKKSAPAARVAATEPELQTLRDLPPQIQRKIGPLVISGYIYSSNQAERSLLINNQLLREGDTVVPGLILEQMLRGSVVLNYQGYRYRMPY